MKKNKKRIVTLMSIAILVISSSTAYAAEDTSEPAAEDTALEENPMVSDDVMSEETTLPTNMYRREIIEVDLPTVSEVGESPFDFIVDPQYLIYETEAALYGGGSVEEDAALLFRNHEGDYDFSSCSDRLDIVNRSNVPVNIVICATITDMGEVGLAQSSDFGDSEECELYLALTDDDGNEIPLALDEEVYLEIELDGAPEDTYIINYDEETDSYEYSLTDDYEQTEFDIYSFGLTGACNIAGDWEDVLVHPCVSITWKVVPVYSDDELVRDNLDDIMADEEEQPEESTDDEYINENEESVVDESNTDNTVSASPADDTSTDNATGGTDDHDTTVSEPTSEPASEPAAIDPSAVTPGADNGESTSEP